MTKLHYDLSTPLGLESILAIYEDLLPVVPAIGAKKQSIQAASLREILDDFDALLLDGYGVLNVGTEIIPNAKKMIKQAQQQNVFLKVLTNGASHPSTTKYSHLGISETISSRDALLESLDKNFRLGTIDDHITRPTEIEAIPLTPTHPKEWLTCDAIGFVGAIGWTSEWQSALTKAIESGMKIMVANPDVAAPIDGGFTREPGFWTAKALHDLNIPPAEAKIDWFGKPHQKIFDLAISKFESQERIAMVGDTLHTDILGGQAAGLKTVLVTGHGLLRDGSAEQVINSTGITPDYIVTTL